MITINTKRLTLKPLGMKYLETVHEYASDIENTRYMIYLPNQTLGETIDFLQKADNEWMKSAPSLYEFALLFNNLHIGAISIERLDDSSWELGWIINKKYWKQGFAYEAAAALLDYSAKELNIKHFVAHCDSENIASYKTMEKLGMSRTAAYGGRKNKASEEERIE